MPEGSPAAAASRAGTWLAIVLTICAGWWVAQSQGISSSNDGSHVALARALGRGEVRIDPDAALTLGVDLARRDETLYSDRPPGTAVAAVGALALGGLVDDPLAEASREAGALVAAPASAPYILTYAKRFADAPPLVERIGTGTAAALHGALMGLIGLAALWHLLGSLGHGLAARTFAVSVLGLGSSFGPYATTLFSHVSAATWAIVCLAACRAASERAHAGGSTRWIALGAGAAGAMAIACDYLLIVAIVPMVALALPRRMWISVALGVLPIGVAVAVYHQVAFGSPFTVGYDYQVNFAFARSRADTFAGDPLAGLWTLVGAGDGGGLLALSPLLLLGLAGAVADDRTRATTMAWLPWVFALSFHATPAGGQGDDHRYLVPLLPVAAAGLAWVWVRVGNTPARVLLVVAAAAGAFTSWSHFLAWHEAAWFTAPRLGLASAAIVALVGFVATRHR